MATKEATYIFRSFFFFSFRTHYHLSQFIFAHISKTGLLSGPPKKMLSRNGVCIWGRSYYCHLLKQIILKNKKGKENPRGVESCSFRRRRSHTTTETETLASGRAVYAFFSFLSGSSLLLFFSFSPVADNNTLVRVAQPSVDQ